MLIFKSDAVPKVSNLLGKRKTTQARPCGAELSRTDSTWEEERIPDPGSGKEQLQNTESQQDPLKA